MEREQLLIQVESATARCAGTSDNPHEPIDLALSGKGAVSCPRCGRRFVRADPSDTIRPAAWPKND